MSQKIDEMAIGCLDKLLALIGLCLTFPIFLILLLWLPRHFKASAIYRHPRAGYQGKRFVLYKFRTMTELKNSHGELESDEIRLTPLGQWLRNWSLDELPQFINVLKGELSFVGPRPLLLEYLPRYSKTQARRHEVLPGLTGWAQIHGRNAIGWEEKFSHDLWYVEHRSFFLNLKILFLSVAYVLRRQHIHHQGYNTMPKFLGTELNPEKSSLESKTHENPEA